MIGIRWLSRGLPKSLVGRVFALYTTALLLFVGGALALFYRFQFSRELEAALERADGLISVVAPAISDNAVIGDYDTIKRTLESAIARSDFAFAAFIDLKGGSVTALRKQPPEVTPPAWLLARVSTHLYDANLPIVVGGRDYGVLRLSYAADHIAGDMWRQARAALALAAAGLVAGLLLIWLPLKHWLGNLGRLQSFEADMSLGHPSAEELLASDAPIEFQRTFEVLSRVAATLHSQREQAAVTLGAIADGVFTLDANGRVVLANPAACEILAALPDAVLGHPLHELIPELFPRPGTYSPWRGKRQRITAQDGRARIIDTTLSPITDAQGRLCGHVLACRDVSEQQALDLRLQDEQRTRRSALTALRGVLEGLIPQVSTGRSERSDDIEAISLMISQLVQRMQEHSEQLSAIFALSPDGFVSFDDRLAVSYVSPAFTRLTGLDASEVLALYEHEFARQLSAHCLGKQTQFPSFDMLRAEDRDGTQRRERRRFIEIERPTKRTLEVALRPGDAGKISQVLYLRDVTLESEVDQMKSEFLSTAAHELRTPMASIYGFSELMMHRKLSPERQTEVISTIYRQTGLMISIVNELLDLARIEARRGKDFVIETLDLGDLVRDVVHDFKPPNERDAPALDLPAQPLLAKVDRSKFSQALGNVLSNAYKYSPDGGPVAIGVELDEEASRVGLVVRDHGIGMTQDQLARVCERFFRADTSGNIPGTGLGMSIVKEIVELLGGNLTLASESGRGTEVTLWLPLAPATSDTGLRTLC
ncbi:ATP-binding protein [Ideonella sp.]|uniref:PAS domain-containing sensor histidine kinase n=1 Tax=Ideonella sp. TaxID=1929293 RepID=UPI0035ADDFA1